MNLLLISTAHVVIGLLNRLVDVLDATDAHINASGWKKGRIRLPVTTEVNRGQHRTLQQGYLLWLEVWAKHSLLLL